MSTMVRELLTIFAILCSFNLNLSNVNGMSFDSPQLHNNPLLMSSIGPSGPTNVQLGPVGVPSGPTSASGGNVGSLGGSPATAPVCDYESYEATGCEDEEGSYCDQDQQRCLCRDGYPVRLMSYCLELKQIGDDCYTTAQCQTDQAGCFIFGKEYDQERISGGHNVGRQLSNWPTGVCRCRIGHKYDNETGQCVKRAVGGWCNEDWDCIKQTFNSQCSRSSWTCECTWGYMYDPRSDSCVVPKLFGQKCLSDAECSAEGLICAQQAARCQCPPGHHYDVLHPGCKPNDDSSCQYGYKWDQEWGRCIPARSSSAAAHLNTRTKHVEPTTTVLEEDDSSPMKTALILVIPNLVGFGLIIRYCYFRKRDGQDGEDSVEDLERTLPAIRPTLSAFDKHRQQIMRSYGGWRPPTCSGGSPTAVADDASNPSASKADTAAGDGPVGGDNVAKGGDSVAKDGQTESGASGPLELDKNSSEPTASESQQIDTKSNDGGGSGVPPMALSTSAVDMVVVLPEVHSSPTSALTKERRLSNEDCTVTVRGNDTGGGEHLVIATTTTSGASGQRDASEQLTSGLDPAASADA